MTLLAIISITGYCCALPMVTYNRASISAIRAKLKLLCSIAAVAKPGSRVVGGDGFQSFRDGLLQGFLGARLSIAQALLELGPSLLDRVQVGRVGWQVKQPSAATFDQLTNAGHFVG